MTGLIASCSVQPRAYANVDPFRESVPTGSADAVEPAGYATGARGAVAYHWPNM